MKRTKQTKGITLVEVVVVMAIIGILLGPILETVNTNMQLNREANERANAKDIALLVQNYIYSQVKWANKVEYSTSPLSGYENIYIDSGQGLIHKVGANERVVYSKGALHNFNVTLEFKKVSIMEDTLTDVKVIVSKINNGINEHLYTNNTSMDAINMTSGSIPNTSGNVIAFKVPVP